MKKGLLIVVFLFFGLALTGLPRMAEGGSVAGKSDLMIPKKFSGTVETADPKTKSISVRSKNMAITIICDDKTILRKGTETKTFEDIKTGSKVTVRFLEINDQYIAKSISINP